jgi:predicted PurR-regulated permease PerM
LLNVANQKGPAVLNKVLVGAIVICLLYFGKPLLLPVALALFLALILTPMVSALQRLRVPRALSVVLVLVLVAIVLGGAATMVSLQLTSLVDELPDHTENIKGKVRSVRGLGDGALIDRIGSMWSEVSAEWKDKSAASIRASEPASFALMNQAPSESGAPIEVRTSASWTAGLPNLLGTALSGAATLGLALVLAFLILLRREALRDRVIRLVGGSMILTTRAVDDASERISRYLRMQLIINTGYGTIWGLGLYLIGLDYAVLWAFMAAILRFAPYIGPWISALAPLALALAQFPGWWELLTMLGLLFVLELVSNNVIEPMLYGRSTGVSGVAMLLSAIFWTLIWGPAGLVLAGPITACLAVVGKHFRQAAFLDLLLGDEPVLEPHVSYYQRLVARDQDEATQIALDQAKLASLDQLFDQLLVPALNLIKRDRVRTDATEEDECYVVDTTREIIEDLAHSNSPVVVNRGRNFENNDPSPPAVNHSHPRIVVMGFPARDAEDQLALEMLRHLLNEREWDFDIETAGGASTGEWLDRVAERNPPIVCVASLPPGGLAHTRYVCKKLRSRFPEIRIAIGRWGLQAGMETDHEHLETVGADQVASTLRETRDQLNSWLPIFTEQRTKELAKIRDPDHCAAVEPELLVASAGKQE